MLLKQYWEMLHKQLKACKSLFPNSLLNAFEAIYNPKAQKTENVLRDFLSSALLVGVILAFAKILLPSEYLFDGVSGINPLVLSFMLIVSGFSLTLTLGIIMLVYVGVFGRKLFNLKIIAYFFRAFSSVHFIFPVLIVIAINRIVVNKDMEVAVSDFDLWFAGGVAILILYILNRVFIKRLAEYLKENVYYRFSYIQAIGIVCFSCYLTPSFQIFKPESLIDSRRLCETLTERDFNKGIMSGHINFYQKVLICKDSIKDKK
jgi:hypothetical protein